jgi:gluconolactonase
MIGADGLTLDRQGRLILATFAGRSLMRIEKDGTRTVLVDRYDGKRFGGPMSTAAATTTSTATTCCPTAR